MRKIMVFLWVFLAGAQPLFAIQVKNTVSLTHPVKNFDVQVSVNESGVKQVAWIEQQGTQDILYATTLDPKGQWTPPSLVDRASRIHFSQTYVDPDGKCYVAWQTTKQNSFAYHLAKKEPGELWSAPAGIGQLSGVLVFPTIQFLSQQGLTLSYFQLVRDSQGLISKYAPMCWYYPFSEGQKKEIEQTKSPEVVKVFDPIVNSQGKCFFLWSALSSDRQNLLLQGAWLKEDKTVGEPITLHQIKSHEKIEFLKGVMNSKEEIVLMWIHEGASSKIQVTTLTEGKWSNVGDLAYTRLGFLALAIDMDEHGHIVATWRRKDQGAILGSYKAKGEAWTYQEVVISSSKNVSPHLIKHDSQGRFVLIYADQKEDTKAIYAATFSTTNRKWKHDRLSPAGAYADHFSFALNSEGNGVIAWRSQYQGGTNQVVVAELFVD